MLRIKKMSYLTISNIIVVVGPILLAFLGFPIFVLLYISKTFSHFTFSIFFPPIINSMRPHFQFAIEDLFKDINKETSKDGQLIKILEIGIGPAANFKFFPKNSRIIALDINRNFEKFARKNAKDVGMALEKYIIGSAEDLSEINSESIDLVVATYVLCSVVNPETVIREIRRVLKPDGKFYNLEHVEFQGRGLSRMVQRIVEPFHSVVTAGCRFNSNIQELFVKNGFDVSDLKYLEIQKMPLTLSPHLYGRVTKKP